jgi:hypothetical protein
MTKILGMALLVIGAAAVASAVSVPEIDAGSGASAIALLAGAVLVVRGRKRA